MLRETFCTRSACCHVYKLITVVDFPKIPSPSLHPIMVFLSIHICFDFAHHKTIDRYSVIFAAY
jgi:hypothetical protein